MIIPISVESLIQPQFLVTILQEPTVEEVLYGIPGGTAKYIDVPIIKNGIVNAECKVKAIQTHADPMMVDVEQ